jgi:hypothetical protein
MAKVVTVDWKPVTPISSWVHKGFYFFQEQSASYKFAVMSKVHDGNNFFLACEIMRNYFKKHGHEVSILRCDAGIVENSESVAKQLAEKFSIRIESAAPECQFQNPSERGIQTMAKGVGAMFCKQNYLKVHPNLSRFRFYYGQPVVSVILKKQQQNFTFSPHGEFGYAVGSASKWNGSTLVYVPSKSKNIIYI